MGIIVLRVLGLEQITSLYTESTMEGTIGRREITTTTIGCSEVALVSGCRTHRIHSTSIVMTHLDSTKGTEGGFTTVVLRRTAMGTVRGIALFTRQVQSTRKTG